MVSFQEVESLINKNNFIGARMRLDAIHKETLNKSDWYFYDGLINKGVVSKNSALRSFVKSGGAFSFSEIANLLYDAGLKKELEFLGQNIPSEYTGSDIVVSMVSEFKRKLCVVGIHQPDYLPWFGFFHKIYYSDVFVILDNCQWDKASFYRRCNILNNNGNVAKLTIPVRKCSDYENQVNITTTGSGWAKKHLNIIKPSYSKSPFFDETFCFLQGVLEESDEISSVNNVNIHIIKKICEFLQLDAKIKYASDLVSGNESGSKNNLLLVFSAGGNSYYSGSHARDYNNQKIFSDGGVKIFYQDIYDYIDNVKYCQVHSGFTNGLSIIDMLFNIGRNGVMRLMQESCDVFCRVEMSTELDYFE